MSISYQQQRILESAADGGPGRLVTLDHEITVDGVDAIQHCVAVLFAEDGGVAATGTYADTLVYERGGWYFASRYLQWDSAHRLLPVAG
jgi:hypothetical protein